SQGSGHSESIGTCHYMAPEVASGKYQRPIDIYAIGVILHEMITGKVPFDGETVAEVLMKHLTAQPDLSKLPEPYRTIVARALAKDPKDRQKDAHELLPPEDAPQPEPLRYIGDGKVAPRPPSDPQNDPKGEGEDVYRRGPEEPIFYSGPETRPPGSGNDRCGSWLGSVRRRLAADVRANWTALWEPPRIQPQGTEPEAPAPASPSPPPPRP